mgnify:CR=1 FL=1
MNRGHTLEIEQKYWTGIKTGMRMLLELQKFIAEDEGMAYWRVYFKTSLKMYFPISIVLGSCSMSIETSSRINCSLAVRLSY